MDRQALQALLGREPDATDQPPGTYRFRARRKAPWQPVRIMFNADEQTWYCLLNGALVGFGADPADIPFIQNHGPFHPISPGEYYDMILAYADAKPGTPLKDPQSPVNLRKSKPL